MKYSEVKEGEWVTPIEKGYKMFCWDCGLVHRMDFRIYFDCQDGTKKIQYRAFRDNRATGQVRRYMKEKNETIKM